MSGTVNPFKYDAGRWISTIILLCLAVWQFNTKGNTEHQEQKIKDVRISCLWKLKQHILESLLNFRKQSYFATVEEEPSDDVFKHILYKEDTKTGFFATQPAVMTGKPGVNNMTNIDTLVFHCHDSQSSLAHSAHLAGFWLFGI